MPSKHIVLFNVNLLLLQTLLFRLDLSYDAQQGYAAVAVARTTITFVVYIVITLAFRISWTTAPFSNIGKYVHTCCVIVQVFHVYLFPVVWHHFQVIFQC